MQRRTTLGALGALAFSAWTGPARAQAWPTAPVRMVVPYAAGGGIDAVARLVAQGLADELKQPFNVDNRGGAGGMLGAELVAKATPDGYTVLLAGNPELTITPTLQGRAAYAPLTDFTPVALVSQSPNVLVAGSALGARTVKEALAAARKAPAGLSIGTPGNGTPQHIAVELLRAQTGLDLLHVPYRGAGPATIAALGGECSLALVGAPPVLPHVASGKLVALAVTQPRRSPLLPEVPTIAEAANLLRDEDLLAWYGLLVPARTPAELVQALEKAVFAVLRKPDTQQRLTALGTDLVAMPSAPFAERMRNESRRYAEIIRRFSIKAG